MKYIKLISIFAISTLFSGCDGSSGGGSNSGLDDGSNSMSNDTIVVFDQSTVVNESDVYDPNSTITNECAAPYWTAIAGIYQGKVGITETNGAVHANCAWDVELVMTRRYNGEAPLVRSSCTLDIGYIGVPTIPPIAATPAADVSEGEGMEEPVFKACSSIDIVADYPVYEFEPQLSTPRYPITLEVRFDNAVSNLDGTGQTLSVRPTGDDIEGSIDSIEFKFDGSGRASFAAEERTNPIWSSNIYKVADDDQ